jgi:hypothetical protein
MRKLAFLNMLASGQCQSFESNESEIAGLYIPPYPFAELLSESTVIFFEKANPIPPRKNNIYKFETPVLVVGQSMTMNCLTHNYASLGAFYSFLYQRFTKAGYVIRSQKISKFVITITRLA